MQAGTPTEGATGFDRVATVVAGFQIQKVRREGPRSGNVGLPQASPQ